MLDGVQRGRRDGGVPIPEMPSLEPLKFQIPVQSAIGIEVADMSVGDAPRPPEIAGGSHSLLPRPSHPFSR